MNVRSVLLALSMVFILGACTLEEKKVSFRISFTDALASEAQDGRLLLLLSNTSEGEPRFQISDGPMTQQVFGVDVEGMKPGDEIVIDDSAFGYPIEKLSDMPEGTYYAQALLNRYEKFTLATGQTVLLPPDKGEGQQWNRKPGNFYNDKIEIKDLGSSNPVLIMDQKIPPIDPPKDTKYIKHIKMESKMLTEWWGRSTELGAVLLLPEGFDEHPEARYPLMIHHGHFPYSLNGFREDPPDPDLEPTYSARFDIDGYNRIQQEEAHNFYKTWTSEDFPRFIVMLVQHANPYYDDSYAVNSANLGPYGDAITYELIPHVEEKFQGIGEGWSRFLYGGSTGGWEALAVQILYPDDYNGCFAACPDPIDFRAYTSSNIYEDENAYTYESNLKKEVLKPGHRDYLGKIDASLKDMNHRELALGTKSRSGQQWDIWEAVYSPQGEDGYPVRLYDKYTGEINQEVAEYWKQNYDLRYILEENWEEYYGEKLQGKIHIYCGDMDNYYLNNAVYLMEEFLENTTSPYYDGEVAYGDRAEHCWNGDPDQPNYISRLRYNTMYVPKIMERIAKSAPPGADLTSWRY